MSPTTSNPQLTRALIVVALYTIASWGIIAVAFLAWAPGRSFAANAVGRLARAATAMPAAAPIAALTMSDLAPWCSSYAHVASAYGTGPNDFSWSLEDDDGNVSFDTGDGHRHSRTGRHLEPRFWFRDRGEEYVVHEPAIVAEVREASRPLRELGHEMGVIGGEMGRHGARMGRIGGRMGVAGARLGLIEARLARRSAAREAHVETAARLRELRVEMEALRGQMAEEQSAHAREQRELSRRMSQLSARHHEVMREVSEKVREIATRARRQGKAERPHVNA